jgi:hypothetical protein|tara:strand:- start:612 stop:785 length:174 start_codon:yes stop_codon:yes gene_type:complete
VQVVHNQVVMMLAQIQVLTQIEDDPPEGSDGRKPDRTGRWLAKIAARAPRRKAPENI